MSVARSLCATARTTTWPPSSDCCATSSCVSRTRNVRSGSRPPRCSLRPISHLSWPTSPDPGPCRRPRRPRHSHSPCIRLLPLSLPLRPPPSALPPSCTTSRRPPIHIRADRMCLFLFLCLSFYRSSRRRSRRRSQWTIPRHSTSSTSDSRRVHLQPQHQLYLLPLRRSSPLSRPVR